MTSPSPAPDILITANRLGDGTVVWLADDLHWREDRKLAGHFDEAARKPALAAAGNSEAANEVTAIYEVPIDGKADVSARERIRALGGPTIMPPQDIAQDIAQVMTPADGNTSTPAEQTTNQGDSDV